MAVDFLHRFIVIGPREPLSLFRRQVGRTATRSVAGHTWRETIPFSFERLYELAPAAVRIEPQVPYEPYDMSVWPTRSLPHGLAQVRYQLHTRNIELLPFVRVLSRQFSALTFRVVTFCLDDSEVASYQICNGKVRKWILPDARHNAHWDQAGQKFGLTDDDLYENDVARFYAEEAMLEEAFDHWDQGSDEPRHPRRRIRNWWNRPVSRDLETEREISVAEIAEQLRINETVDASKRAKTSRGRSKSPRGSQTKGD